MKNEHGFSLVELLIVVAIIAIIAAIAVPSLLTARQAANEAGAIQSCRTLGSAEIAYSATTNQQYATLAQLVTGSFVDSRFNDPLAVISGYVYTEDINIADPAFAAQPLGGAAPAGFGFLATHQAGLSRFDYEIGMDQVVRWGPTVPLTFTPHNPISKAP
jgi:prepilin-type N-terminal cleavage/methylation domain-containing protein